MTSKTKADELDIDVEAALEQALDFEFDDDALEALLATKPEALAQDQTQEKIDEQDSHLAPCTSSCWQKLRRRICSPSSKLPFV